MLVLKRLVGQEIVIGNGITVMVTEAENGWARLGIVAPPDVPVHRREVYDEMAERGEVESLATQDRGTCEETKGEQQ